MKKRAAVSALGTLLIVVIVLSIILFGIPSKIYKLGKSFFSLFGVGEAEAGTNKGTEIKLSYSEAVFNAFISAYESCKSYSSERCICEQFDVTSIPQGYSIKLQNLGLEKTRIELYGNKPTPEKAKIIENDNLCLYEKQAKGFLGLSTNEVVLGSGAYPYKISNKIQLFKHTNKMTCFVSGTYESKAFDEIAKTNIKCGLKSSETASFKTGMLDLSDYTKDYSDNHPNSFVASKDADAASIVQHLSSFLQDNIGKVTRTTEALATAQSRLERRRNMFNNAYADFDANKDSMINDDAYFISIRALQVQLQNSPLTKDYFIIHYLRDSEQSELLAMKIIARLKEMNGKLIYNDKEISIESEVPPQYKMNFIIAPERNSKENIGPVFLACADDYSKFQVCKENALIPAVFIDIVEVNGDGYYLIEGHHKAIARKIYEGVNDYLEEQSE
ncbi:hypothetical protein J4204_02660 [Candidatus Woesearchaeota archaeon]|nr:hypothetical protein [Candidatus Woesearchaeota archaeon]